MLRSFCQDLSTLPLRNPKRNLHYSWRQICQAHSSTLRSQIFSGCPCREAESSILSEEGLRTAIATSHSTILKLNELVRIDLWAMIRQKRHLLQKHSLSLAHELYLVTGLHDVIRTCCIQRDEISTLRRDLCGAWIALYSCKLSKNQILYVQPWLWAKSQQHATTQGFTLMLRFVFETPDRIHYATWRFKGQEQRTPT